MKQTKKGFSLAEVLIAMGIISIIATIGFTLGRRGVESAYNQYIYTGYKGISMAIANAVNEGLDIDDDFDDFMNNIAKTLNLDDNDIIWDQNIQNHERATFPQTANGTIFIIQETNANPLTNNGTASIYSISMSVPAKKTRGRSTTTICLDYLPNHSYGGVLIPSQGDENSNICLSDIEDIRTRKDLLPFFIDDGLAGRVLPAKDENDNTEYQFNKRQYYSIEEALCYAHQSSNDDKIYGFSMNIPVADCSAVDQNKLNNIRGAIKVADPRKVN